MQSFDFIVIGGGIAGVSAAARLASHGKVLVIEAESALGYHSSGRSAAFYHFGLGNPLVRALTAYSRPFFDTPPEGFSETPLAEPVPAMFIATEAMRDALGDLHAAMARYTDTVSVASVDEMRALCPVLRFGADGIVAGLIDSGGRRLDADALLQGFARVVKRAGAVETGAPAEAIERSEAGWTVTTRNGRFAAPVLVNAAGAWADAIATMAGVAPIGLTPKRRTIIVLDPPEGVAVRDWPFIKTPVDEFYMLSQGGRILVSPTDEVDCNACDAQPEEYDIALAAWRAEQYTTLPVARIAHKWAGLRTFAPDRMPVAGFAPDAPGFFWLAGQGGFGLQTSPAMAAIAESLATGGAWPAQLAELGVTPADLAPDRATLR